VTVLYRILLLVAVLLVVWRVLAALGRKLDRNSHGADSYSRFSPRKRQQRREWAGGERPGGPERLVACSVCGTFVPARRALTSESGGPFCGPACREASKAASGDGD
jgi:hypothetical protein